MGGGLRGPYPATVTQHPAGPAWRARTVAIPDPGPLEAFLDDPRAIAWLRHGDGMVGLGVAERVELDRIDDGHRWWESFSAAVEHETELPGTWGTGPLAFGSFVFDPAASSARSVLVVPRTVLGRRKGRAWLTTLVRAGEAHPGVPSPAAVPASPGAVGSADDPRAERDWMSRVADVVRRITDSGTSLAKVVLARSVEATAERAIDPRWLVGRLAADYPTCWTFHVEGLVGASPELLIRSQGGLATSRVLAGTIQRGAGEPDVVLKAALARSAKDLNEHEYAVQSVAEALEPFCSGMNVPEAPFVLHLPNVMHLASDVTGVADPDVSSLQLAGRLHPSAAVCGTPTMAARATIAEVEGMDRGRYAGPVGWIDARGDGEWAIALRCGQVDAGDPRRITLFAGCGIVDASDPGAELAETKAKLQPMLTALGATGVTARGATA